jgi:hypothetical protein
MTSPSKFYCLLMLIGMAIISRGQSVSRPNHTLEGKWTMELTNNDIGIARTIMEFRTDSNTYTAYTRKNADRDILGWWTSSLGRTFTKDFKEGRLLHIVNGNITENKDSLILSGIFTSALGNYYFNGTVKGITLHAVLTNGNKEIYGYIHAVKEEVKTPLENYPAIFKQIELVTRQNIYNPEVMHSKEWKTFDKNMQQVSAKVQDDLEMVFAFFYYAGKLPFTHYHFLKMPAKTNEEVKTGHFVSLEEKNTQTACMKITSFSGNANEIDSVFDIVNQKGYKNLIVDLRDNPGGTVEAGMQFAKNIADTTFYGGIFLTQKWFSTHKAPPALSEYSKFQNFTDANFDLIISGIHDHEGLCLKVIPREKVYRGKIFILVNRNTASTCEPIVYGLKQRSLATIVGETTAGVMLNGEFFSVMNGFKVIVPTADYYTSDGYRIDKKGVIPDIQTKDKDALDYVLGNLLSR